MLSRSLPFLLATLVLALYAVEPALGHDKAEGTVVQAGEGKLTLAVKGNDKKHTLDVAKEATVTLDGKAAKLEDLKEGFHIVAMLGEKHVITKIDAHSKAK
ncbi:MAG: hypothetical protein HY000_34175 [Planctomycetes bacterium]|nr:hypothetical protein [Planctomycetota bacterium]